MRRPDSTGLAAGNGSVVLLSLRKATTMDNNKETAAKKVLSLRRIDYRIKATKAALSLDRIYRHHMPDTRNPVIIFDEFGMATNRMSMLRRYLWLLSKLGVLSVIRLGYILSGSGKQSER